MTTNAQLAQQVSDLLAAWNTREAQFRAWLSGTPTGGPNGNGKYPLTDAAGVMQLVDCPAKLADTVGGPAALSADAQALAEAARDSAVVAKDRAVTAENTIAGYASDVLTNKNLALLYRNDAAAYAASLAAGRDQAVAAKVAAEAARDAALISEDNAALSETNALASANAAAASAALAATFDPNDYYTKVVSDGRFKPIGYVPAWSEITSKPTTFPPSAHSHVIADVTGLQTALDGKQAAGSYAAAVHTHVIGDVTGLQSALDGKQAAGSYAAAVHTHVISDVTGLQAALDGKVPLDGTGKVAPTYLPSYVDDVVEAADLASLPTTGETGKIYVTTNNSKVYRWAGSVYSEIVASPGSTDAVPEGSSNLYFTNARALAAVQSALDGKQPVGSYLTGIDYSMVVSALGFTPIQQGGGTGQGTNKLYIGWLGSQLGLKVDADNYGASWPINVTGNAATVSSVTSGQVTSALGYTPANLAGATFTGGVTVQGAFLAPGTTILGPISGTAADLSLYFNTNNFYTFAYFRYQGNAPYGSLISHKDIGMYYNFAQHIFRSGNGGTEWARFNASGYLGIGTSSPTKHLTVASPGTGTPAQGNLGGVLLINTDTTTAGMTGITGSLADPGGTARHAGGIVFGKDGTWNTGANYPGYLSFWTRPNSTADEVEHLRITSGGFVGIGTASPEVKLDLNGPQITRGDANGFALFVPKVGTSVFGSNYDRFEIRVDPTTQVTNLGNSHAGTGVARALAFFTGGSERVRIDTAGYMGIGVTSPGHRLDVAGVGRFSGTLLSPDIRTGYGVSTGDTSLELGGDRTGSGNSYIDFHSTASSDYEFRIARYTGLNGGADVLNTGTGNMSVGQMGNAPLLFLTSGSERVRIDGSGNFGIGVSPSYKLHVSGDIYATGNVTAYSDRRLKDNIATLRGALDLVSRMRGVSYTRKDTGEASVGVIAQEMREVLPEVVMEKNGHMGVAYGNLVGVLIEAVKELRAELDDLRAAA